MLSKGLALRYKVLLPHPLLVLQIYSISGSSTFPLICRRDIRHQVVFIFLLLKSQRLLDHLNLILVLTLWLVFWGRSTILLMFSSSCVRTVRLMFMLCHCYSRQPLLYSVALVAFMRNNTSSCVSGRRRVATGEVRPVVRSRRVDKRRGLNA